EDLELGLHQPPSYPFTLRHAPTSDECRNLSCCIHRLRPPLHYRPAGDSGAGPRWPLTTLTRAEATDEKERQRSLSKSVQSEKSVTRHSIGLGMFASARRSADPSSSRLRSTPRDDICARAPRPVPSTLDSINC